MLAEISYGRCGRRRPDADVGGLMIAMLMCLVVLSGCGGSQDPNAAATANSATGLPPDLHSCTRLDIRYGPEVMLNSGDDKSLFSPEEIASVTRSEPVLVEDPEKIGAFAGFVASGTLISPKMLPYGPTARISCFRNEALVASLSAVHDVVIILDDNQGFRYSGSYSYLGWRGAVMAEVLPLTPQLHAFQMRRACAHNLWSLNWNIKDCWEREKTDIPPAEWCDALIRYQAGVSPGIEFRALVHPAGKEGECHYAMNVNCRADSPADMVLLFETKAGWNQHGGPGLFTFDNHDPRGGLVLLNDGTVKFIRTEEDLKQLRWE